MEAAAGQPPPVHRSGKHLQPGLIEHRDSACGPIFGLFDDSLPDGWGLLLMDRFFQQRGSALAEVSVLDRLAYLGPGHGSATAGWCSTY
jgi:hypothetical protein